MLLTQTKTGKKKPYQNILICLWPDERGMLLSLDIMRIRGVKLLALCCVSFPKETRYMPTILVDPWQNKVMVTSKCNLVNRQFLLGLLTRVWVRSYRRRDDSDVVLCDQKAQLKQGWRKTHEVVFLQHSAWLTDNLTGPVAMLVKFYPNTCFLFPWPRREAIL